MLRLVLALPIQRSVGLARVLRLARLLFIESSCPRFRVPLRVPTFWLRSALRANFVRKLNFPFIFIASSSSFIGQVLAYQRARPN